MKILYKGPAQTPEWFQSRKGKVTASRAANIVGGEEGVPGYLSPLQEWHLLRAELGLEPATVEDEEPDEFRKAAMQFGLDSEPMHARDLGLLLGKTLEPVNAVVQDEEYPWLAATPDYRIVGENEGCELKAPAGFGIAKWRVGVPFGPQVQAAVQARVMGWDAVTVSAYYQDEPWGIYVPHPTRFERAEKTEHFVLGLLEQFWQSVQEGVPPEPKAADYEAVRAYSKPQAGVRCDLGADLMEEWLMLEARDTDAEPEAKRLEADWKALKAKIIVRMGAAELGIFPDGNGLSLKGQVRNYTAKEAYTMVTKPSLKYVKNAWTK